MSRFWMVRSGLSAEQFEAFRDGNLVAVGYQVMEDLAPVADEAALPVIIARYDTPSYAPATISALRKIRFVMQPGDRVVTYDSSSREYHVGEIVGAYRFDGDAPDGLQHTRPVEWKGKVSRDDLSVGSRNTLGSTLTVFEPGVDVWKEIQELLSGQRKPAHETELEDTPDDDLATLQRDVVERAHEFIKDKLLAKNWEEMQEIVAAVLRAMGYKARVSPQGGDRGCDIVASPDGLGLEQPRIRVEVKHRPKSQMGAPELRAFLGGLRQGDRGLFVSTGGFTREARYEAERAQIPLTLVDVDQLVELLVQNYDQMNPEGRALVPLTRVYWPVS